MPTYTDVYTDAYLDTYGVPSGASPAVVASWPASRAVSSGFYFPFPSARPLQVSVTNTAGDWLFALCAWRPANTADDVSVCVADDAHNYWDPVGMPAADSPAAGAVRTALWAAPAARVANPVSGVTSIQIAPTGPYLSLAVLVVDMSGILPWMKVAAIAGGYANAATSLALSAAAPAASAVLFSVTGSDNNSDTITGPSGWTALTAVAASNGTDHTADVTLTPAWQLTGSAPSSSVSSSGSLDLAGVIAGVLVGAPAPVQPSADWPVMITEAAIGSGIQTPPSQLTWTDVSARALGLTMKQGHQYTLGQMAAGQGTLTLDNADGALIPPGSGAFAGIDSGTPFRRRVIIPAIASPHYVAAAGTIRRLPWSMRQELLRGQTTAETADVWASANGTLNSMAVEEWLLDDPHSLWPMTDPAGSLSASNLAAGGVALSQVTSKYGTGTTAGQVAAAAFGAASGTLVGAGGAKVSSSGTSGGSSGMWQQTLAGASLAYNGYGFALQAAGANFPPVSGGATVEVFTEPSLAADLAAIAGNGVAAVSGAGAQFTVAGSSFPAGMPVYLTVAPGFSIPSPFAAATVYYVTAVSGTSFSLSATQGGSAIATTSGGSCFINAQLAWDPVIMSLRDGNGTVAGLSVRNTDGALLLLQRNGTAVSATALFSGRDFRTGGAGHLSLAVTQTTWRVLLDGGGLSAAGTFSPALPASFREVCFGGVQDATEQGYAYPGLVGFGAVFPGVSPPVRVLNRSLAALTGLVNEASPDRVERLLEYAGLAGRRLILSEAGDNTENDLTVSGQDIGGQAAAGSLGNIAQSTLPALLSVAPTGDVVYLAKSYSYNQPVKWTLGTNAAGGEIPFTVGISTDYDPTRLAEDVQLTGLDTQAVTVPAGVMSATTMAAVTAATANQYGGQPYATTGYLTNDWSSPYAFGASLQDLANWLANVYNRPQNRVQAVTVDAAANSANAAGWLAWQFWAGAAVGDMVQVNIRVPTAATSPLISMTARITQTQRSSKYAGDGTAATIACVLDFAPEYQVLVCDDPVRGLLNGVNLLGWLQAGGSRPGAMLR